jgi:stage III sporulation protein AE
MIFCKKAGWGMALLFLCLIFGTGRTQKIEAADTETDQAAAAQDELLAELDFDAIQQEVDSLLSSQQFSFAGTVRSLLQDGDPFCTFRAGNAVLSCAKTAFLAQKGLMKELFLLVLAGAVLGSFSSLFEGKQVRDASFYMVYLLALALILKNFQSSGENLKAVITSLVAFMRILTPSYYLAAAGGASSAVMFYQMLLLVILAVEKLLLALVLPMIHIYLLIALVNDLSGEEILSHMTELLETCVNGLLKSSLGVLVGMQMIRNLIAPALDSLRQMALWRTAGMIPGIGNAVNAVTELVAGSAVLIRNCFGVTAMLVLLAAGMVPAVQLLVSGLSFRLLAAAAQPVSDKRIAGCLAAAGKGYAMLLRLLLTVEVLFLLTIAILAGTFS